MVIVLNTLLGNTCRKCVCVCLFLKTQNNSPSMWFQDGSYLAEFLLAKGYKVGKQGNPWRHATNPSEIIQTSIWCKYLTVC